jgi:hypothetical protein
VIAIDDFMPADLCVLEVLVFCSATKTRHPRTVCLGCH